MNSCCLLLKNYSQCSISRRSGAIALPKPGHPDKHLLRPKVWKVYWYKCTRNRNIYWYSNGDVNNITTILWVLLVERFTCWLCCQCNEFETVWIYQKLSTSQWQHGKERWLFKTFQSRAHGPCFAHKLSQHRARVVPVNRRTNSSTQNKKNSGICQYLLRKIYKWGFKNFVLVGASGIIHGFFFYEGQKSAGHENCGFEKTWTWLVRWITIRGHICWNDLTPNNVGSSFAVVECTNTVKFCSSRMHQHSRKIRFGTEGQDRLSWHDLSV